MSFRVRRVPKDWVHPTDEKGNPIRLTPSQYDRILNGNGNCEKTHYQMYEYYTPVSPVMDSSESLARWLADNYAREFNSFSATYEQWLCTIERGFAPSLAIHDGKVMPGVVNCRRSP